VAGGLGEGPYAEASRSLLGGASVEDPWCWPIRNCCLCPHEKLCGLDPLLGGSILSIRSAHITALAGMPDFHKDPFDRMLIAQAAAEGLTLVTNDVQIQHYSVKTLW